MENRSKKSLHKKINIRPREKNRGLEEAASRNKRTTLDGKTWLRYSISVWNDLQKDKAERDYKHPAMFPRALVERLVKIFGLPRPGPVLDPFMGSGSTLCAAYACGLPAVGFEISPAYIQLAQQRLAAIDGKTENYPWIIQDDSRNLLQYLQPATVSLCITSPPYWDILDRRRSADGKTVRNYGCNPQDLSAIKDYAAFLQALQAIFAQVYTTLAPGAYCIAVVMDIRKKANFFPLHLDLTQKLKETGFTLDDIIIWDRRQDYNNLRPLGYPYVFRVNKIHEYILIFQKR